MYTKQRRSTISLSFSLSLTFSFSISRYLSLSLSRVTLSLSIYLSLTSEKSTVEFVLCFYFSQRVCFCVCMCVWLSVCVFRDKRKANKNWSFILLHKVVRFFRLKLKISESAGLKWLHFPGKLYKCLGEVLDYFPDSLTLSPRG